MVQSRRNIKSMYKLVDQWHERFEILLNVSFILRLTKIETEIKSISEFESHNVHFTKLKTVYFVRTSSYSRV